MEFKELFLFDENKEFEAIEEIITGNKKNE
jgi:hypothetical protein